MAQSLKLTVSETLPEHLGTTWTKTTHYEGRRPVFVHIWADNIIVSRLVPDDEPQNPQGEPSWHV